MYTYKLAFTKNYRFTVNGDSDKDLGALKVLSSISCPTPQLSWRGCSHVWLPCSIINSWKAGLTHPCMLPASIRASLEAEEMTK